MARPAPTPKQNFIQTLLIVTTVFLGMQILCNRPQAPETRTRDQILDSMRTLNTQLKDVTIAQKELGAFKKRVQEDSKPSAQPLDPKAPQVKALTKDEVEKLEFEASILVADTQLKAGIDRKETQRLRNAYHLLESIQRKHSANPNWTQTEVKIPPTERQPGRFEWRSWTGPKLYDKIVAELSTRNKDDLVWGFMPGGHAFIDFLVGITGRVPSFSYWFAALLLALVVRAIIYPLAQKQLMWGRQMSQLAPMMKEIKEKYPAQQEQQAKIMELYQEYGINPMAGCGPALIQMPLFLFVYQCMLHYQFEFQNGTFAWINPATSKATGGFVAPNLGQLDLTLIIVYGISMCVTTLLQPVNDPTQAKTQRMIGLSFAIMVPFFMVFAWPVPSAFVLYWTFTNVFATIQSLRAYRMPMEPLVKKNTKTGGAYPKGGGGFFAKLQEQARVAQEEQAKKNGSSKPTDISTNGTLNGKTGTPAKHKPKKRK